MSDVADASFMFTGVNLADFSAMPVDKLSKLENAFSMFSYSTAGSSFIQDVISNATKVEN